MQHFPTLTLKPKAEYRILGGHNWVFSNEIDFQNQEKPEPGAQVRVNSSKNYFLGYGFFHPNALIAVRLYSLEENHLISADLFGEKIKAAIAKRDEQLPGISLRRLIFSDSDEMPGLIVDQFGKGISIQIHSLGVEPFLDVVIETLRQELQPELIVLRNDTSLRKFEELTEEKRIVFGENPVQRVQENGFELEVDLLEGQKTGYYIDQRDHRAAFGHLVKKGDWVLDAFCNEGAFSLVAASKGAEVLGIDISAEVLKRAEKNAQMNNIEGITWEKADVMKWLPLLKTPESFDVINLDPPNFTRNRRAVPKAKSAYRKLHENALSHLKVGGFLMTSCCSHHISEALFLESVQQAAFRSRCRVNLVYRGCQPPDHPIRVGMPETDYLKCLAFQKIS